MEDYSLLCPICIETYRTPKLIEACGHSFCEQCLFTYVTTLKDKGELGSTFPCPVCRQEVAVPLDTDITLSWIQTFPINADLLDKLAKTPVKKLAEVENRPTILCDPCVAQDEQNRAVKFCVDCQEHLCKECVAMHKKYKIFQNHKLYELTETELLNKFTDLPTAKCAEHTTRDIEMYCGMHKVYVCCKCATLSHRECAGLMQISEMKCTALKRLDSLKENFKMSGKHIEGLISQNDSVLSGLPNKRQSMIERLKAVRDKIVTTIDALIENAEVQTKQQLISLEAELAVKTETLQDLKTKCQTQCEMIDTVSKYGLPVHKVRTQSTISEEFLKMEKDIHINGQEIESIDFQIEGIEQLEQLYGELQKCSKKQVKVVRKDIDITKRIRYESDLNKTMMNKVLRKEVHTVRLVAQCSPTYTGITVMDDKHLLLTDNCGQKVSHSRYNFSKRLFQNINECLCGHVCLYDVYSKSITTKLKMNKPFSTAVLKSNPGHIVVSEPNDKQLHIVSIKGNQMAIEKTYPCNKKPYSLISLDNGHVGVTWESPPSFSIVDLSGNEMKTVQSFRQDSTGRKFKAFQYVAVNEHRSLIIQPCSVDNTVYCFDYAGHPVFEYKDKELRSPCGVDMDKNGFIYICSGGSGTVHVITPYGYKVKVIKGMPQCMQALCVEDTGDQFWCTSLFSENCDKCYSFSFAEWEFLRVGE